MGTDVLWFPDVRVLLLEYIDGIDEVAPALFELPLHVTWRLQADAFTPPHDKAIIHIEPVPGSASEGYIDRAEKIRLDCYAPGQTALGTLKAVTALLVGDNIETPSGFIDTINVVPGRAPVEIEFQSETLNQASAVLEIITRPVNTAPVPGN